jgi:hypothetical protein
MKCYAELTCNDVDAISDQIYQYIANNTDILNTTKFGWHFIDCRALLNHAPSLTNFFKVKKLLPRHAAITIVTESDHLPLHVDEPPVVAKINFPVRNTTGWVNRWFDHDEVIAELYDLKQPIVFNSQIAHSVEKILETTLPRLVASFTFYNEPIKWLK